MISKQIIENESLFNNDYDELFCTISSSEWLSYQIENETWIGTNGLTLPAGKNFPSGKYGSVAVINMAATWMPNVAINIRLKSKQEEYKSTVYVKDLEKTLVQKWGLSDDNSDVMLFGKDGKVLYSVDGKFTDSQVKEIVKAAWDNL